MSMMSHIPNKQAGISLMLAVLILSAITAIAFSLSTIVFIELRSSGDVVRTEPNLYAAFGVTEEALFQYKRFVPVSQMDVSACPKADSPTANICSINNVKISLPAVNGVSQPIQFDDTPTVKVVSAGSKIEIPLYQTSNYNKQYGKVQIDILPGATNSLKVSLRKTDSNGAVTCYPNPADCTASTAVSVGTPYVFNSFDLTGQYDLILDNSAVGSKDLSAEISTYDTNGTTAKGMPFVGQDVLKIVADYLGLSRTYRVQIPLSGGQTPIQNVALGSNGATASASSSHPNGGYPPANAINGERAGNGWLTGTGGWNDDGSGSLPDWFEVDFNGTKSINEVDVFTVQDTYWAPSEPTPTMTFTLYGVKNFQVQYDSDPGAGVTWTTVPGGSVINNNLVWRKFTFGNVSTDKIRIYITAVGQGASRLTEVEAWGN